MATKSALVPPLTNRFFLFNYFEQPEDTNVFKTLWNETADYLENVDHYISTHLHHSSSPTTKYPWVNYATFDSTDICVFGKPDPNWTEQIKKGQQHRFKAFPGQFREVASYNGNPLNDENRQRSESCRFFVTGVKVNDSVPDEEVEKHWSVWSGADFIHERLKDNPSLVDSLLYKGVKGGPRPLLFRYTVRTELKEMDQKEGEALAEEVNARPHPEGVETFTGFYNVQIDKFHN